MSPVNDKAGDPPNARVAVEEAPQGTVALADIEQPARTDGNRCVLRGGLRNPGLGG